MMGQGCSGDGAQLACLFSKDSSGTGTLKVFDPITKTQTWGSAQAGSHNLSSRAGTGQVPFIASGGDLYASDDTTLVHYDPTGAAVGTLSLSGSKGDPSFGVVGLGGNSAYVTQKNGVLTVFALDTLANQGSVTVLNPKSKSINVSSPASAHGTRGYLVATDQATIRGAPANGYLIAVDLTPGVSGFTTGAWQFPFQGTAGASAVVVTPEVSQIYTSPLILVNTPAVAGATPLPNYQWLVGVLDNGASGVPQFSIQIDSPLQVAPLIDPINHLFYFVLQGESILYVYDFTGAKKNSLDLRELGASLPWSDLVLDGHVVGTFTEGQQTVLLSGGGQAGQFVMGVDPVAGKLLWNQKTAATREDTLAWTIEERSSGNCPIFVGATTGINVLCP